MINLIYSRWSIVVKNQAEDEFDENNYMKQAIKAALYSVFQKFRRIFEK